MRRAAREQHGSRTAFACPVVAGVDEVGRGPLAGPVVAAAVILPASPMPDGLADSKKLSAGARERLDACIREHALAWCIAEASVEEIDRINILQASLLAMQRAVAGLRPKALAAWVDGNHPPQLPMATRAIVGGDGSVPAISAASIIAKVARDRQMVAYDSQYPGYGLARHKGYGTAQHLAALSQLGATPIHRASFAPVARIMARAELALSSAHRQAR